MTAPKQLISTLILSLVSAHCLAHPFKINAEASHEKIRTDVKTTAYLKVALTGLDLNGARPPLNIALVIDRSGSMRGQRIKQAKEAAKLAISMLKADDILSLIAYDTSAELLLPSTKVGDGSMARRMIDKLSPNGSTALFAGTEMGGAEVSKFLDRERVNRVILLSDGIANVGPSSTPELARLGATLAGKGIAVSTIGLGLGYNEDLMAKLADSSDGNHSFVERPDQLAQIMSLELNDAIAVVAQDVEIKMTFPKGIRPVKTLGREADFQGQVVTSAIKQLITGTERYVLIELEVSPDQSRETLDLAEVVINYRDQSGEIATAEAKVSSAITDSAKIMTDSARAKVMESVVELTAREQQEIAIKLKDEGQEAEAIRVMDQSNSYLRSNAAKYGSQKLKKMEEASKEDTEVIKRKGKGQDWSRTRKQMRKKAYSSKAQMAF